MTSPRPLLLDGGTGSALLQADITAADCPGAWPLERAEQLAAVHRAFIEAGADIVLSASFSATTARLASHPHLATRVEELCARSITLVREAIEQTAVDRHGPRVAGNIGAAYGPVAAAEQREAAMEKVYRRSAEALARAGAELLFVETIGCTREALCALRAGQHTDLPVLISMVFSETPTGFLSLSNEDPRDCLLTLEQAGADGFGINCNLNANQAARLALSLLPETSLPLAIQPCAGQPRQQDGRLEYPASGDAFISAQYRVARSGAAIVGGCCGITAADIARLRVALDSDLGAKP